MKNTSFGRRKLASFVIGSSPLYLTVAGALPEERIMGVETGGCPHTAIREDCSLNLAAVDTMREKFPNLDLILNHRLPIERKAEA